MKRLIKNKLLKIEHTIIHLLTLNHTPHGIALGVALGVFIAITPTYGFHTLLVILAAFLIPKANKIAIFLGTNISLPPTVPFITWGGYEIGRFMMPGEYPQLSEEFFKGLRHLSFWQMFEAVRHLYWPLFAGSVVLGLACALIFYVIAYIVTWLIERKRN
jgi:uncharacterized protein (DUF2062 family)